MADEAVSIPKEETAELPEPPEPPVRAPTSFAGGGGGRLIPALAPGPYVVEPEDIDRFYVRIQEDGTLFFKGSRERIEAFLRACDEVGLVLRVRHIALCG